MTSNLAVAGASVAREIIDNPDAPTRPRRLGRVAEADRAPTLAPCPPDDESTRIAEQVAALIAWLLHLCRAFPPSTTGRFANLEVD